MKFVLLGSGEKVEQAAEVRDGVRRRRERRGDMVVRSMVMIFEMAFCRRCVFYEVFCVQKTSYHGSGIHLCCLKTNFSTCRPSAQVTGHLLSSAKCLGVRSPS